MHKELLNYIKTPEKDVEIFNLARWYENKKHLSPACGFYLKCAEFTKNKNLAYECLIRLFFCYQRLSNREKTCECMLKQALSICPKKPEAYFFLSKFYESKNWGDSYLYSCLGLENSNCKPSDFIVKTEYEAEYMLLFQKALSSWWNGKPKESRFLFQKIKNEHIEELNEVYFQSIEKNITSLGSGSIIDCCKKYKKNNKNKLKFKFKDSDKIDFNFSQTYQDMFVLFALNGKKNGTYLEIGSSHPFENNNTALLEKLGWKGIGIEIKKEMVDIYNQKRKNKSLCLDALKINYDIFFKENFKSNILDYLQLDVEPSKNTFEVLLSLPLDKYKFRTITYEHDHYVDMNGKYREKSRRYLKALGYKLAFNDISPNETSPFEDWWVHPELINENSIKIINNQKLKEINEIENLFLS